MTEMIPSIDQAALAELKDIMEDEFSDLLETFLRDSAERLQSLRSEFREGNAIAFGRTAHSLKGSCVNIGARKLGDLCYQAESKGKAGDFSDVQALLARITAELYVVKDALSAYIDPPAT